MEKSLNTEEEIFCLKYELNAMSDILLKSSAERWVHNFSDSFMEKQHLSRYEFASKKVNNLKVLDIAGGSGFGSYYLAVYGNPQNIDSIEIDVDAIRYGSYRYSHPLVNRIEGNAEEFKKNEEYDIIVSFETIEHLKNYDKFLENVHHSLKPNGKLIISTPIVEATTTKTRNPFHVIEWSFLDFQKLISEKFKIENIYLQDIYLKPESKFPRLINLKRKIFDSSWKRPNFELFEKQYPSSQIVKGLQILECIKLP